MLSHKIYPHSTSSHWVVFVHGAGGSSVIWYKQLKAFKKEFNLLLIDLRGHGNSQTRNSLGQLKNIQHYTFDHISNDILEVLDYLNIQKAHFIGISLGTILIREITEQHPERVHSAIMGGAVLKINLKGKFLIKLGNIFQSVIPYIWLYKLFAFVIMPKNNHKKSRNLFIREARKLYQKEFKRWYKLTSQLGPRLKFFRQKPSLVPTLYIMGEKDHMFLPSVKEVVIGDQLSSLVVVPNSGHVVNVDAANHFNHIVIAYIKGLIPQEYIDQSSPSV
ncbi:MAG: alpha/beta hydrolase [Crocinitomicaceae bacterium]|nr:alpha/beta hydrolase [Crocinitomicaceae bacterium]